MRVLVTGASGFIGSGLSVELTRAGREVVPLARSPREGALAWNFVERPADAATLAAIEGVDGVVHLAGENLLAHRWTPQFKERLLKSRAQATSHLAQALAALKRKPQVLISASGVGFYGNRGEEVLTESSPPGTGFLAEMAQQWEAATAIAAAAGIRVVPLRIGFVLDPRGGGLAAMLAPFRFGLGGRMGSGIQWMSWIALTDLLRVITFVLETPALSGPVNTVAPNPVTNAEFAQTLGRVLHRPAVLPAPGFALKLMLGAEVAREMLLYGARVQPAKLLAAGFKFEYPELEPALHALLEK